MPSFCKTLVSTVYIPWLGRHKFSVLFYFVLFFCCSACFLFTPSFLMFSEYPIPLAIVLVQGWVWGASDLIRIHPATLNSTMDNEILFTLEWTAVSITQVKAASDYLCHYACLKIKPIWRKRVKLVREWPYDTFWTLKCTHIQNLCSLIMVTFLFKIAWNGFSQTKSPG